MPPMNVNSLIVPVPKPVRQLFDRHKTEHPGLLLDRYVACYRPQPVSWSSDVQKPTIEQVVQGHRLAQSVLDYAALFARWQGVLGECQAKCFRAKTAGPFTLHLARAGALENAGISLHPIYGFPYIPGSGLKGIARAYAETVWLPGVCNAGSKGQPEISPQDAWKKIERVFGYTPQSTHDKSWLSSGIQSETDSAAGSVVFFEAWPTQWPTLIQDILNNHHAEYYQTEGKTPPGDFEDPIPVYFLAIDRNVEFLFAVGPRTRQSENNAEDIELAVMWLLGGLQYLGAGSKTSSGYGRFVPTGEVHVLAGDLREKAQHPWRVACSKGQRAEKVCTLRLVMPAFLAGAEQGVGDCQFREATLRGLLRWWWRTMYVGYLDSKRLYALESLLWGNTNAAGALELRLVPNPTCPGRVIPAPFREQPNQGRLVLNRNFVQLYRLRSQQNDLPLLYFLYGMDEFVTSGNLRVRRRRYCLWPPAQWTLALTAKPIPDKETVLSADQVLEQGLAALWLLCYLGGVGSKCRKGWGSLALPPELKDWNLEKISTLALKTLRELKLGDSFNPNLVQSPSLGAMRRLRWNSNSPNSGGLIEVTVPTNNPLFVLNELSSLGRSFAQSSSSDHGKHCQNKGVLGLPRKIHGPLPRPLPRQDPAKHRPPQAICGRRCARLAAPVFYHLDLSDNGHVIIRVVAFPIPDPFDIGTSERILKQLLLYLHNGLSPSSSSWSSGNLQTSWFNVQTHVGVSAGTSDQVRTQQAKPGLPNIRPNDEVEVELLERTSARGTRYARIMGTNWEGPITNTNQLPPDLGPGSRLRVIVQSISTNQISFRWAPPTQADRTSRQRR